MKRYYSAAQGGFFDDNLHGPLLIEAPMSSRAKKAGKRPALVPNPDTKIPADAVEVSEVQYRKLLDAQTAGQKIDARAGQPVAVDRIASAEELEASRRLERDKRLAASDWTQLADTLADDPEAKASFAGYRKALRELDMSGGDWPVPPMVSV